MQNQRDATRDIFDVIATYFTNNYWILLYKHAVDGVNEQRYSSIEDSYRDCLDKYLTAFTDKNDEQYTRIIQDLHKEYNTYFHSQTSLGDFIDVVSHQLIPKDYYAILGRQDSRKNAIFRQAMCNFMKMFTVYVATEGLSTVLYRRGPDTVKYMTQIREYAIKLLFKERTELYGRFIANKTGVNPQRKDGISREVFEKMQHKIKMLIHEKAKLTTKLNSYANYILILKEKLAEREKVYIQPVATQPRLPPVEVVESALDDTSVESSSDVGDLPRINDSEEEKEDLDIEKVAAPLDAVSEYSGEDFIDMGSEVEDDELIADE